MRQQLNTVRVLPNAALGLIIALDNKNRPFEEFRMFRPLASWPALIPLLLAGVVQAEEASAPPEDPQTAPEQVQAAEPPVTEPAPEVVVTTPSPQPAASGQEQEHAATDRLPTATRPGFIKRHPVSMPKMSLPKTDWSTWKPSAVYAGGSLLNDMLGVNTVALTGKGIFYARLGRFVNTDQGVALNGGWRRPITGMVSTNGYSGGVFFGHLMGDSHDGEKYNRLGVGADLTYQWVNAHTLKSFGVGVGVGEERTGVKGDKKRAKPGAFFSYSVSLKVL